MRSIRTMFVIAMLALAVPASAQQTAPVPRAATPSPDMKGQPSPQGFSVVLVLGDLNSGSNADASVPPAARKALNDMKDFLPYKGYRLLDAEWILGSRGATTRLRGAEGQDYELRLSGSSVAGGKLRIAFQLLDATGEAPGGDMAMLSARMGERAALEKRIADLQTELAALRAKVGERNSEVQAQEARIAELKRRVDSADTAPMAVARGRRVIDTSFDMDIGETVVVGTSRLKDSGKDSGRALIALLTAVPKAGAPKQD